MPSLRESKVIALQYVDEHRFLPDYVKPLVKEVVVRHFQALSNTIGVIELSVRRTEANKPPRRKKGKRSSRAK